MSLTNSIDFSKVKQSLSSIKNMTDADEFSGQIQIAANSLSDIKSTVLGSKVGEVIGGVESLTQEIDFPSADELLENVGVAKLTDKISGFSDLLKIPTGPVTLSALTGLSEDIANTPVQLTQIISSPSAASVAANLEKATGIKPSGSALSSLSGDFGSLSSISALGSVNDLLDKANSISDGISNIENIFDDAKSNFESKIDNALSDVSGGILNRLLEKTSPVILNEVTSLSKGLLTFSESMDTVQNILDGNNSLVSNLLTSKVSKNFPLDNIEALQEKISLLDPSITNMVGSISPSVERKTVGHKVASKNEAAWKNPNSDKNYVFTRVHSYEEILSDMQGATRDISEVVVHWSATYINQDIGAEEIHQWHQDRDFSGCGYHYVVRRDGSLQRGRPLNIAGAHAKVGGHNQYSIGICLVGGYACPSGTKNAKSFANSSSINNSQWKTLNSFLKSFYTVFPGGQVWGHNDTDPKNKIDPGISMQTYIFQHFGKRNLNVDGRKNAISSEVLAAGKRDISTSESVAPESEEVVELNANTRDGPFVGSQNLARSKGFFQHASYPEMYDFQYVTEDWKDTSKYTVGKKFTEYTGHQFYNKGFDTNVYQIWEHIVGSTSRRILVNISDSEEVNRWAKLEQRQAPTGKINRG